MDRILIIDDEPFIRENVDRILSVEGYKVLQASNSTEALEQVSDEAIDLVLLDLSLGIENGIDVLKRLKEQDPELLVIIITGYGSVESAIDVLKLGAFHCMKKPFKADALRVVVKLALQTQALKREVRNLKRADGLPGDPAMIGRSWAFTEVLIQIRQIARIPSTVLITGESGTGKELVARAIHDLSDRKDAPFISINCASIPASLLESELFGHEKGSVTNAISRKKGLFEEAHHGTIFLDEIAEIDMPMQAKLLRVLQERVIRRVGGLKDISIDVRVISATNRNLLQKIGTNTFREDLFCRLHVFPITVPPLRDRLDDIPLLAAFFLESFSRLFSRKFIGITPEAMNLLQRYSWPGNIRELRNVIERICIMNNGPELLPEHLPTEISSCFVSTDSLNSANQCLSGQLDFEEAVTRYECNLIRQALERTGSNVLQTSLLLNIPRGTLRYKIEKYNLVIKG
jgi:DNA-binding NtrC family response regulator